MPRVGKRLHERLGEMQPRGRRCDRALVPREHCLIIAHIARVGGAARGDVRRQRHGALRMNRLVERRPGEIEGECHLPVLTAALHCGSECAEQAHIAPLAEVDAVAGLEPLGRPRQGLPAIGAEPLGQGDRDLRASLVAPAHAAKLGRNDLGVVEHQRIAGCEQIGEIADHAIGERLLGRWIHHQQPRRVARGDRAQRD